MVHMKKRNLLGRIEVREQAPSSVVGVTWYTAEENWHRVKAAAIDPERFEESYAEWFAMAAESVEDLKRAGVSTVKVSVVPDELLSWCVFHNKPNNAASRAEFVSERLRSQDEAGA